MRKVPHVAVVGAGSVGATIVFAALLRGLAERVSLYDINAEKTEAEVLDLRQGLQFVPSASIDGGADIEVCRGADIIVITAGAKQKAGQSRLELAAVNARICRTMVPQLLEVAPDAVLLMVTNPVDVVTSVAIEAAGLPEGRVFGSGTVLDSSRLRLLLAQRCGVAVQNVHAYIVGEHGDSELALWSSATIGAVPIKEWVGFGGSALSATERYELLDDVRKAALKIIAGKGATNWAVGLATARILEAILRDENRVLPVTAPIGDFADLDRDVCLSIPRVVGKNGAGPALPTPVDDEEREQLAASAEAVESVLKSVTAAT
ncbi:MAG TPA: L-lactate dehydrogenase [Aldersonia sp.]